MIDTSPWLACSGHTISSTRPSVTPFQDFLFSVPLLCLNAEKYDYNSHKCFPFFFLSVFVPLSAENYQALRAESAWAFTGRRNSYSGRGEDFLSRQPNFFTETAATPERKVEKWFPRWEINRHAEG